MDLAAMWQRPAKNLCPVPTVSATVANGNLPSGVQGFEAVKRNRYCAVVRCKLLKTNC